jgi:hypothetical protein
VNTVIPGVLQDRRLRDAIPMSFYAQTGTFVERIVGFLAGTPTLLLLLLTGTLVLTAVLLPLALVGLVVAWRGDPLLTIIGVGLCGYFLLITGPVIGPKYRLPMEPFLTLFQAAGVVWLMDRARRARLGLSGPRDT